MTTREPHPDLRRPGVLLLRDRPSLPMRLVAWVLGRSGTKQALGDPVRTEAARVRNRARGPARPGARHRRRCTVTECTVAGRPVTVVAPASGPVGGTLVHLHGGAYINPVVAPHWDLVRALALENRVRVVVPQYPLAPDARAADVLDELQAWWGRLAADEAPVLAGDSAGGGLALALTHRLRAAGEPQPRHLLLFAPWLDVALTDPRIDDVARRDPTLAVAGLRWAGELWAGGADLRSPDVSPLHGDPTGLCPVTVVVGTRDLLEPDCRTFHDRAVQAGVDALLVESPGAFHVFVAGVVLPESRRARAVVRDRLAG